MQEANDLDAQLGHDFRQAMRRLAATVTIITAADSNGRSGMVATAVTSVSAAPPSLMVCINQNASIWAVIRSSRRFAVNLLSTQHSPLVHTFSGKLKGEERFADGEWDDHYSAGSSLADAVATLFCDVDAELEYGTHSLFVGAVHAIRLHEGAEPLLWKDGGFAGAVPLEKLLDD